MKPVRFSVSLLVLLMLLVSASAHTQTPNIVARRDSLSICPRVQVKLDRAINASRLEISPIFLRSADPAIVFDASAQSEVPGIADLKEATLNILEIRAVAAPEISNVPPLILFDDSSRLAATWEWQKMPPAGEEQNELYQAIVPREEIGRLVHAQRLRILVGKDTLPFNANQIEAVQTFADAMIPKVAKPGEFSMAQLTEGFVDSKCEGPSPQDLQIKWAVLACLGDGAYDTGTDSTPTLLDDSLPPGVYNQNQVDAQARVVKMSPPLYPDGFKRCQMPGKVLARFIVREDGTPDMTTMRIAESTHRLFAEAVRKALATAVFEPGKRQGKSVNEAIWLPFEFRFGHP